MEPASLRCLFRMWGHSREEDSGDIVTYRPAGFGFPLSRGRDYVEFMEDGTARFFGAAPDDRTRAVAGHWRSVADATLEIQRNSEPTRRVTVLVCDDHVLKFRNA